MLRKILSVKNVGTYRNHNSSGREFQRLTLIHGENGRGKTTLCAAMRSFRSGDSNPILERQTLGTTDSPYVDILLDTGKATFSNATWSVTYPTLEIFDAEFVAENVYSGDFITHDHKRNLCRVVLGVEGVKLAEEVDRLDGEERQAGNTLNSAKEDVQRLAPGDMSVDAFLSLKLDEEIRKKIEEMRARIQVAEGAAAIQKRGKLTALHLAQLPENTEAMLGKTIEGVSEDAERKVLKHIEQHIVKDRMRLAPENWLSLGVAIEDGKVCPMCAQSSSESPIIGPLREYFSQSYRSFQRELEVFGEEIKAPINDEVLIGIQRVVGENTRLSEFWSRYVRGAAPELSFEEHIQPVVKKVRDALEPLIKQKLASPLQDIQLSESAVQAIDELEALRGEISRYNEMVDAFNLEIDSTKASAGTNNLQELQQAIAILEAQEKRWSQENVAVITAYTDALAAKQEIEKAKERARQELDSYNDKVISSYHDNVNEILRRIGAGFKLATVKVEYTGRTPRAAYTFEIRGVEVAPGSSRTSPGTPCFRNTLSAGDRNTLAFAFFVAQLQGRSDLEEIIVLFDDPFTSLDSSRRHWTCHTIRKIANMCKQVIVLSHSLEFLQAVAERSNVDELRTMQIVRQNEIDSHIIEMDLSDATATQFEKDVIQLRSYQMGDDHDKPATVRAIRPVLENHIRATAPDVVPNGNGWLGSFLGMIKQADATSPLAKFKNSYEDLDGLNSYTSPFAHDSGECPAIEDGELQANVELTLSLIGRL